MFAGRQLTQAPHRSLYRRIPLHAHRSSHETDLLIFAPGPKDCLPHAANMEAASDRSNDDCVLAAHMTRSGGFFHRRAFILGHCDDMCPHHSCNMFLEAFAPLPFRQRCFFKRCPVYPTLNFGHFGSTPLFQLLEAFFRRRGTQNLDFSPHPKFSPFLTNTQHLKPQNSKTWNLKTETKNSKTQTQNT